MNVQVPIDTFAAMQKFTALFASGNSIPVDINYLISCNGPAIIAEGQKLNNIIKELVHKNEA